jgi:hypothetical protein
MGVDLSRVASKALEAALEDVDHEPQRKGGGALKAVAAGAALAVAAKAASSKTPWIVKKLVPTPNLDGLRDIPDRVRDRLADAGWLGDDQDIDADDLVPDSPLAEQDEDVEDEEDAEPEDEGDEDFDEDEDEGEDDEDVDEDPEAEADEDFEDEDEDEDEGESDDEDELDEEDAEESDTPALDLLLESDDDEDVDPAERPPKPPRSKTGSRR